MEFQTTRPSAVEADSLFYMDLGPLRGGTSHLVVCRRAPELDQGRPMAPNSVPQLGPLPPGGTNCIYWSTACVLAGEISFNFSAVLEFWILQDRNLS